MVICTSVAYGQEDCDISIDDAKQQFKDGKLDAVVKTLTDCATKKYLTDNQLFEAYHILALAHLNLGEKAKMKSYIRKMLSIQPDYGEKPNNDPTDFTKEVRKFRPQPMFTAGIKAGLA